MEKNVGNLIAEEARLARAYELKIIPKTNLPELSPDNVARVEAMIQADSRYSTPTVQDAESKGEKYKDSVVYWMKRLKELLEIDKPDEKEIEAATAGAVKSVDRDNSTHINSDGVGRNELSRRIYNERKNLLEYLKDPNGTSFELIEIISKQTNPTDLSKYKKRENVSFASKFCHYACFYMFDGKPEQDNYSILDNIVIKALPKYMEYFKVKNDDFDTFLKNWESHKGEKYKFYKIYQSVVDEVISASENKISRNGFDHILWYYFKGRV